MSICVHLWFNSPVMCGRFTQTKSRKDALEELAGIELPPLFHGRYNIAPMQKIAIIRQDAPNRAEECIWGFENPRSGAPIINARSETLAERPMFKDLLPANRCLVPADGFYEWKGKQPYYFQLPEKPIFAFAGLWRNGRCAIITRSADGNMQGIHHRMPAILPQNTWSQWISPSRNATLISTIVDISVTPVLTIRPVSRRVNNIANDDPACLAAAEVQADLSLFPDGE
ncbi:MAG: SOS response-associated peptidase [Verrucomicrobiota bacterium]